MFTLALSERRAVHTEWMDNVLHTNTRKPSASKSYEIFTVCNFTDMKTIAECSMTVHDGQPNRTWIRFTCFACCHWQRTTRTQRPKSSDATQNVCVCANICLKKTCHGRRSIQDTNKATVSRWNNGKVPKRVNGSCPGWARSTHTQLRQFQLVAHYFVQHSLVESR